MGTRRQPQSRLEQRTSDLMGLGDPSGLAAPTALPEGWQVKPLGEVATLQRGKDLPIQNRTAGMYPVIGSNGIMGFHNEYFLEGEGVVTGRSGTIGKVTFIEGRYWAHNTSLYVKDFHGNFPKFIYYLLQMLDFPRYVSGVSVPTLNRNLIHPALVVVPPLNEQRAIARVLSTLQCATETQDKLITAARQVKRALMRHLFTYGAIPPAEAARVPLKETEIGAVPEGWEVLKLGTLLENDTLFIKNGFPQGGYNEAGEGVPHLRPFNVDSDGGMTFEQIKYVPAPPSDSPYWVENGDVIFNNTNSEELVGKTAYFQSTRKCVLSNHMTLIRVLDPDVVDAYWLAKRLHSLWEDGLFRGICRRHVNQASVGLEKLKNVTMPLPPITEQRAIARILTAVDNKIAAEEKRKAALQTLFKTTLHQLMTGQVRVPAPRRGDS